MYKSGNFESVNSSGKGRELKDDERTSITSGEGVSCLLLQDITADDSGKYDVCVENVYGADYHYSSVSVEGPPDPPSGKPYVSDTTTTSAIVVWSGSPYDGGRMVTGYILEYSLAGSDVWTTAVDDWCYLSYEVQGLRPGARYIFRVKAINAHGPSKPSQESDVVTLEEYIEDSTFEPRIVTVEPGEFFKKRYEVHEELGKGRFGVVHKVVDRITSQKLAGKFIRCRTNKDRIKVQEEIDIMNLLRHPKLLQLAAAFENQKEMIMVMEYISGGELFERVVADDFTLTEKDCILFMRQICEGVAYMHSQNIVHLDLKPENIMCHTRTSHEIKLIDFGLAQKLSPDVPVRVLFGTPEFIPPEIVSFEPIGIQSDMWSVGVICYVLLSGLSPFMGDNDNETFANITRADYDFDDEAFDTVSKDARDFIAALLIKRKEHRMSATECLKHKWLDPENHQNTVILSTDKLKKFIIRRKWQKTGNAIRALSRLQQYNRRNSSSSSATNTSRSSLSGKDNNTNHNTISRMSSLEEESTINNNNNNNEISDLGKSETEKKKLYRTRSCSERSDSGISDCSNHALTSGSCSCTSTPLLGKRFSINEEPEYKKIVDGGTEVKQKETDEARRHLSDKVKRFSEERMTTAKQQTPPVSLNRPSRFTTTSVANVVKKFDQLSTTKSSSQSKSPPKVLEAPIKPPLRYRSPSPSLTRKTLTFMAKERPPRSNNGNGLPPKGVKPKSESFQKASAFWSNSGNSRS